MAEPDDDSEFQIAEYCARLSCKKLIAQTPGRGRRREYCSETCRRGADREYKRAKTMVEHFERVLHKTRHEVAAYARRDEDALPTPEQDILRWAAAHSAMTRVRTLVEVDPGMPEAYRVELTKLVDAVTPLIGEEPPHAATA